MGILNGRDIIGIHVLYDDFAFSGRITDFPSCLVDIFLGFFGHRIDLLGLFCQELSDIWDGIATAVGFVKVVLLRHGRITYWRKGAI